MQNFLAHLFIYVKSLPHPPPYPNAHVNAKKMIFDIQYPGNRFEFGIISNDFWSSTIWASHIRLLLNEVETPKNPGIQPSHLRMFSELFILKLLKIFMINYLATDMVKSPGQRFIEDRTMRNGNWKFKQWCVGVGIPGLIWHWNFRFETPRKVEFQALNSSHNFYVIEIYHIIWFIYNIYHIIIWFGSIVFKSIPAHPRSSYYSTERKLYSGWG